MSSRIFTELRRQRKIELLEQERDVSAWFSMPGQKQFAAVEGGSADVEHLDGRQFLEPDARHQSARQAAELLAQRDGQAVGEKRHEQVRFDAEGTMGSACYLLTTSGLTPYGTSRTERHPHLLAGDPSVEGLPLPNHSNPWTPQPGRYRLVGTPYADRKSSGMRGKSLTVGFEVIDSGALR